MRRLRRSSAAKAPARPHPGAMPSQFDSRAHVMEMPERQERWRKAGMCPKCGRVKTHSVFLRGVKRVPLTVPNQVYKGKCLKCHTITQAQLALNEQCDGALDMDNRASVDMTGFARGRQMPNNNTGPVGGIDPSVGMGPSVVDSSQDTYPVGTGTRHREQHENEDWGHRHEQAALRQGPGIGSRFREEEYVHQEGLGGQEHADYGRPGSASRRLGENVMDARAAGPRQDAGGEYMDNQAGVPCVVGPRMGGLSGDDMSVMSEISLDPSIMTMNARNYDREESLEMIQEEVNSNDVSATRPSPGMDHHTSFGNMSPLPSHGRTVSNESSLSPLQSHTRTVSNESVNQQSRVGSVAVEAGGGFDRLMRRKIAEHENRPSDNAASSAQHSGGRNDQPPAPQAAHSTEPGHVHFMEGQAAPARGAQPMRAEDLLHARIQEKQRAAANHGRSHSEGPQSSVVGQKGYARTLTDGANIGGSDQEPPIRAMSNEENTTENVDRSYGRKPTNASGGSLKSNVTPGAQHVKDGGEYVTLLDRKIGGERGPVKEKLKAAYKPDNGDGPMPSLVNSHLSQVVADDSMSESEARSLISDCSGCVELMNVLKRKSSSNAAVSLMALGKLRSCLLAAHNVTEATSSHQTVTTDIIEGSGRNKIGRDWPKVIMMVMSSHSRNGSVQAEVLHTLWAIVTLNPRYATDLMSNADMEQIVTAMETHTEEESVQEYGCGLLACLAATEKHALRLKQMCHGKFIHRLMTALYFEGPQGNVQANALKALFRLSLASLSSDAMESFSQKMGYFIEEGVGDSSVNAIIAVINAMELHKTIPSVQIYGTRLLWGIFSPDDISDPDYIDILLGKAVQHIESVMTSYCDSLAFHEAILCLLSKISYYGSDALVRDPFLAVAIEAMKCYPNSDIIALHGCRCIANVCIRSPTASLSKPVVDGFPVIISSMGTYQEHIIIQSEVLSLLATLCKNCPPNKQRVQELGGIDKIVRAYDSYSPNEDLCVANKIRACVALTTLAVDPIILSDIRDEGVVSKFERLLEDDVVFPDKLLRSIQCLLALVSEVEGVDQNLAFREEAGEDETCECLRANIRAITTPDFTKNRIKYLRYNAIDTMHRFPTSSAVHENACKLLACVFALASEGESVAQDDIVLNELESIITSLVHHKSSPTNATAACSAIQNLCILMSLSDHDDAALSNLFSRAVVEVVNDLVIHREDELNLKQATGALQALCAMREGLALTFETDTTIGLIVGAMDRFPTSAVLQKHIVGILGSFFSVSNNIMEFVNDELVAAIVGFIKNEVDNDDAADLVDTAVNIILTITNKGFQGVTVLLRDESLVDSIVSCMWKWPEHLSIQSAGVDILSNVALDNYLRADVCQRGGTSRIICALDRLRDEPMLVSKAYSALANLISGADVEILRARDAPAPSILVSALKAHPQHLPVQVGGAHALWALSARNDSFKDEIVTLGGAEAIAVAMGRFLGSKEMQAKGFVALWSCAVPRHLKSRVGQYAIEPAVNGLSAHISSEKVCEDALGCLKCLSTIPVNKDLLEDNGAVDLIYSCLWLHSRNPSVCKAALAALCNISVNVDTNEVSEITHEDLEAIVHTMRTHKDVKGVQESAIILLRNFTFSSTNIMIFEQNPFLVPLIRSAMTTFNDHFNGRADDLLRVLPSLGQ